MNNLKLEVQSLFEQQVAEWTLAKDNYEALSKVKTKEFAFEGYKVRVQFNSARITSSSAKVDAKSIQERKCFLCPANLPQEQKGVTIGRYQVLVNPFPIFREHFTIPSFEHADQLLLHRFGDMLDIAKELDSYTLFYNGPKCGASAPDHAHFQACTRGVMPLEEDMKSVVKEQLKTDGAIYAVKNYLRNIFFIQSSNRSEALGSFQLIYSHMEAKEGETEPMMNVLMWYAEGMWNITIVPREKHRPSCYFAQGVDNILISPGSVDLGGLFIIPQEKDFDKITKEDIEKILKEICLDGSHFQAIIDKL